jgi:predicted nuclease of predicted toxin-antitoxin system
MRFLVDENLPVDVAQLLQHEGHDVLYLAQSGYRGATDEEVWSLAAREERIVITRDLDFPMPDSPRPPGLVLVRVPDTFTRKQIARVMSEFIASAAFQQVPGTITVISPGRVRVRSI